MRIADVFFFSADRKYTTVRHAGGTDLIEDTLRALEDELAPQFVRVHRNALVNSERITAVEREPEGQYVVRLRGIDDRLPVSRRMGGAAQGHPRRRVIRPGVAAQARVSQRKPGCRSSREGTCCVQSGAVIASDSTAIDFDDSRECSLSHAASPAGPAH